MTRSDFYKLLDQHAGPGVRFHICLGATRISLVVDTDWCRNRYHRGDPATHTLARINSKTSKKTIATLLNNYYDWRRDWRRERMGKGHG